MRRSSVISQFLEGFLQLVYPPVCVVCKNIIKDDNDLQIVCTSCLQKIERVPADFTRLHILDRLNPCYLDHMEAVFQFDEIVQIIIHQIKYQKADRLARAFATYARQQGNQAFFLQKGLVLPVPLFAVREKERGFNQSRCIAEGFYRKSDNTIYPQLLRRRRATRTQTELSRQERLQNVSQAFAVDDAALVSGQAIILVDDVVTTGATLNECALVLKKAGAIRVSGLSLATPTRPEHFIDQLPLEDDA